MDIETDSLKLWYNSFTDRYLLEIMYDKSNVTLDFYIYLYRWSHIVLSADLANNQIELFVNQQRVGSLSEALKAERPFIGNPISFLKVGTIGRFDIDDIQYSPKASQSSEFYGKEVSNNIVFKFVWIFDLIISSCIISVDQYVLSL